MDSELVFSVSERGATVAHPISLADAGLREREDLQEWIRLNPEILGSDVRIVTFEFAAWTSRAGFELDRLDLLGIDSAGRLVVAELKRGQAPDTIEMQAVKYAAFASRFTPDTLALSHAAYLSRLEGIRVTPEAAMAYLVDHLGGDLDPQQLRHPRIVLVAAGFSPQVTATAVWLSEMGVDLTLLEFAAYQAEHDMILTVSQLWPLRDVEEFTVSPRQVEARATEERSLRTREARAVTTVVSEGRLDDGTELRMTIGRVPVRLRGAVESWLAEDPRRGISTWRNDTRNPLIWSIDGSTWSPTGLAKEIVERASGERPAVLQGPRCWTLSDGRTLADAARFGSGTLRDWTALHDAMATVQAGEWTTYGDLAEVIGSSARPVGQHITSCTACPNAYRVLTVDGSIADQFRWSDSDDVRSPREVLEAEGVSFENDRATVETRVGATALSRRVISERASIQ